VSQISRELGRSGGGRFLIILVALVVAVIVAACEEPLPGPTTARIAGRLTLEGRPMQPGFSVVFMEPQRGDLAFGKTDADGRFVVNSWKNGEMDPGRYKVYVVPPALRKNEALDSPVVDSHDDHVELVPYDYEEKYRHLESTPLEFKVVVGQNQFEIDLSRAAVEQPAESTTREPQFEK